MDEAERCGRLGYIYMSNLIALGTVADLQKLPDANPPNTSRLELEATDSSRPPSSPRSSPNSANSPESAKPPSSAEPSTP